MQQTAANTLAYADLAEALKRAVRSYGDRHANSDGLAIPRVPGLRMMRPYKPSSPLRSMYRPLVCLVLQGAKLMTVGREERLFTEGQSVILGVDAPVIGQIVEASADKPHLAVAVELDMNVMQSVAMEIGTAGAACESEATLFVDSLDDTILNCAVRLMRLIDHPEALDDAAGASRGGAGLRLSRVRLLATFGVGNAQVGNFETAAEARKELISEAAMIRADEPKESLLPLWAKSLEAHLDGQIALIRGDARTAVAIAERALVPVNAAEPGGANQFWKDGVTFALNDVKTRAEFMLGDYVAGEQSARAALAARKKFAFSANFDELERDATSTLIALALLAQGRAAEAREMLEPVVKNRREKQSRNHGDNDVQLALAAALYVQALAEPSNRTALLKESATLMDSVPADFKKVNYVQRWRARVSETVRGVPLRPAHGGS